MILVIWMLGFLMGFALVGIVAWFSARRVVRHMQENPEAARHFAENVLIPILGKKRQEEPEEGGAMQRIINELSLETGRNVLASIGEAVAYDDRQLVYTVVAQAVKHAIEMYEIRREWMKERVIAVKGLR